MIKNYIKTAWRNLACNKSYAAINIIALAIGIAACLLIFLIVQFDFLHEGATPPPEAINRIRDNLA